ncbi:MAG: WD40 repeat domain-containing protein [Cyclobacteriaceae bacterium]
MSKVTVNKVGTLTGHRDCVYGVVTGSEHHEVFSSAGDGMVVKWNLKDPDNGELVAKLPNSVYALHYLKESDVLMAGQNFEGIHLLDYREKKEIRSLKVTSKAIFDICSLGETVFVASGDGSVYVVDMNSWRIIHRLEHAQSSARCIAINLARMEMAVGYSDNAIRVFSLVDYQLTKSLNKHQNSVFSVAYDSSGRFLLSGSRDAHLKIWDSTSGYSLEEDIVAHMYTINHIAFSPNNKHFVTCSMDKSIKVWSWPERKLIKVIDKARFAGHGTSVNKLAWTSFNDQLVSASDDRTLSVWDLIF